MKQKTLFDEENRLELLSRLPDQDYCDKNDYSKRAKDLQAAFGRKYVPIDCGWCTFYIDEQRLDEADEIIMAANEAYMRMLSEMMDNGRK